MRSSLWLRRLGFGLVALCAALMSALLSAPTASARAAGQAPRTWYVHVGLENSNHSIQVMTFSPSELWINEGDTVVWRATSAEIHTVTFTTNGAPPPQPFTDSGIQIQKVGGSVYTPGTFFNSGTLSNLNPETGKPQSQSYSLKFTTEGSVTYYCWVHPMMSGKIHVREEGTAYPHTQQWYDQQAANLRAHALNQGEKLKAKAEGMATDHAVVAGIGDDMVDVMLFIRKSVTIHVGQSVTYTNWSFGPHTVTFGQEIAPPPVPYGDPKVYDGSKPLSSGFLMYKQSFTVTFTKAGDFPYICALHDYMGMVGVVHVKP